ncbi:MAG: PaaX family transcriptional regulator C-terminal domain-containing protein [Thermoanaerobaculia bacterium]|nr:PaaX family transcriptional regulator C-terminal domain-containing protein [Thermoanaerobaculia bacterium]
MTRDALLDRRWRDRPSARALLLTLLGEFVAPEDRLVPTRTFVAALGLLGVGESNARQALTRSAAGGWLESRRAGREVSWRLSRETRRVLRTGAERIYGFGNGSQGEDAVWTLLHVEAAATDPPARHRLETRLAWAGFGSVDRSLWLSPDARRAREASQVLADLGLAGASAALEGKPSPLADLVPLVERAWDLDAIADRYVEFLDGFRNRRPRSPAASFAELTRLVHEWRSFPLLDPQLPAAYLPGSWPGRQAARRFRELRQRWAPAAGDWWRRALP